MTWLTATRRALTATTLFTAGCGPGCVEPPGPPWHTGYPPTTLTSSLGNDLGLCAGVEPAPNTACVDLDGVRYDLDVGQAAIGPGTMYSQLVLSFGTGGIQTAPYLQAGWSAYLVTDTLNCLADQIEPLVFHDGTQAYDATYLLAPRGTACTIRLEQTGSLAGDAVAGSIVAQAYPLPMGPVPVPLRVVFRTEIVP